MFNFRAEKLPVNELWLPMNTETPAWTDLVPVSSVCCRTRQLFVDVSAKFYATLPKRDYKVCRIYHIQNLDLWHKYQKYVCTLSLTVCYDSGLRY